MGRDGTDYSTRENARSGMSVANEGEEVACMVAETAGSGIGESGISEGGADPRSSSDIGRHPDAGAYSDLKGTGQAGTTSTGSLPSVVGRTSKLILDEEEYSMLLGVIERYYWLLSPVVQESGVV